MLRVLNCRAQKDITPRVFSHLNQFPALSLLNVEECNLGPRERSIALHHGWKYKTGKDLSDWLVKGGTTDAGWDSVIRACFRLGGAFSIKTLTAEGVEAVDAIPSLHLSLGGAPRGAAVDVTGDASLRSFQRTSVVPDREAAVKHIGKRPLSQGQSSRANQSCKKPTMRAGLQRNIEDLLTGLGG